jgi:hypothetical protein
MPWSGGSYTKGNNATGGWTGDASLGIGIEAGRHDTQDNDFATGINQCLNKDGSNAATGPLNAGGFKVTNIANATNATDAMAYGQIRNGTPLYMDTVNNRIGIGTTTPTSALTTIGNTLLAPNTSNTAADIYHEVRMTGTGDGSPNSIRIGADGTILNGVAYIDTRNIGASAATPLSFRISGTERVRIDSQGKVGIGLTNPSSFFHVKNSLGSGVNAGTIVSDVAGDLPIAALVLVKKDNNSTTSQVLMQFLTNGAATGQGQINANGALQAAFGSYSDERLKENIQDLPSQLANIFALRPVEFDYKDGSGHQIGFIAQEVQDVYPDLIGVGKDGYLTLSGLGKNEARMIKAFQEFAESTQATITALEARVAALEA